MHVFRGDGLTDQPLIGLDAAAAGDLVVDAGTTPAGGAEASLTDALLLRAAATTTPETELPAPTRPAKGRSRRWLVHRVLVLADVIGLLGAFALAEALSAHHAGGPNRVGIDGEIVLFALMLPAWVVVAKLHGLYDSDEERTDHTTIDDLVGVLHLVTLVTWLFVFIGWATGWAHPGIGKLLVFSLLALALVPSARAVARAAARRSTLYVQNAVVVGAGAVGHLVVRKLRSHPEYGVHVVGFVDSDPLDGAAGAAPDVPLLGGIADLPDLIEPLGIERVVVAFSLDAHDEVLHVLRLLRSSQVQVDIVPRLFEVIGPKTRLHTVEGLPLIAWPPARLSRGSRLAKRAMDLVLSVIGLVLLAPVLALIAVLIKLDSPGPVFFRQVRVGSGGKTFRICKFRTMRRDAEALKDTVRHLNIHLEDDPRMFKVVEDPRVTPLGRSLRRLALDELPQLINVVRGEMSLVGPRPLILEEDDHVREWARTRLKLKPGITGMWQVLGASDIPFDEMTRLDYIYVTNWSLWGDIRLIARTFPALARSRRTF
ncbi:MAG TPA: sugar transferase [Gaiellaceae bacterium]|nr:sugar transferase [Gaiellaceae bacterium]